MVILSFGTFDISPYDSVEIALALVAGQNLDELQASADRAMRRYNTYTAVFERQSLLPKGFELHQNYPNPFNPSTTIRFNLPKSSFVTLKIFDTLGKEIATLINEKKSSGEYTIEWNGKKLPSGTYMYQLRAGEFAETRKLILQK